MAGEASEGIRGQLRRVRETVSLKGWDVVTVGDPNSHITASYTVGLQIRFRHPDLVIVGAGTKAAHAVLHEAVARIASDTWRVEPGLLPDLLKSHKAWACTVRPQAFSSFLPMAADIYPSERKAIQIIIPDGRGNLPWDKGFAGPAVPLLAVLH